MWKIEKSNVMNNMSVINFALLLFSIHRIMEIDRRTTRISERIF